MLARTEVQSRWWRLFAIVSVIFATPILLGAGSTTEWLRSAAGAVALVGLTGYAFGFRIGPRLFWRVFSVLFMIGLMVRLGKTAAPTFRDFPNVVMDGARSPFTIALGFALLITVCLALFRHAGLVPSPTAATPASPSEPLVSFASRQERWARAHQAMAEARAEIERPMSPEMEAQARSFGPGRQLTLEQHRRITTFLLLGVFAAQAAIAFFYGITPSILFAAITLLIGGAATTFHSAELTLKAQAKLAQSWRAVACLVALTVGLFLVPDSSSPMLWLSRVVLADIATLLLGNLLASSFYALTR